MNAIPALVRSFIIALFLCSTGISSASKQTTKDPLHSSRELKNYLESLGMEVRFSGFHYGNDIKSFFRIVEGAGKRKSAGPFFFVHTPEANVIFQKTDAGFKPYFIIIQEDGRYLLKESDHEVTPSMVGEKYGITEEMLEASTDKENKWFYAKPRTSVAATPQRNTERRVSTVTLKRRQSRGFKISPSIRKYLTPPYKKASPARTLAFSDDVETASSGSAPSLEAEAPDVEAHPITPVQQPPVDSPAAPLKKSPHTATAETHSLATPPTQPEPAATSADEIKDPEPQNSPARTKAPQPAQRDDTPKPPAAPTSSTPEAQKRNNHSWFALITAVALAHEISSHYELPPSTALQKIMRSLWQRPSFRQWYQQNIPPRIARSHALSYGISIAGGCANSYLAHHVLKTHPALTAGIGYVTFACIRSFLTPEVGEPSLQRI